jgi:hypothetical protein
VQHGFTRGIGGRIVLRLDELERRILTDLVGQLVELVAPEPPDPDDDPLARMVGIDADAERPDDPVLLRLFPDAYRHDVDAAAEFRRFTERSLRETKSANAATVLDALARSGSKVVLGNEQSGAWLGTLNDLRLVMAGRLGLDEDNHDSFLALPEDHPARGVYLAYDWLTFLQETLLQAMLGTSLWPEDVGQPGPEAGPDPAP